jgi:hypothetical protein
MNISVHVLEKVDIERVAYHVMEVIISVRFSKHQIQQLIMKECYNPIKLCE